MKKNNNESQKKVVIYALYNEEYDDYYNDYSDLLSEDIDKEREIKRYCEDNNYKIIDTFRSNKSDYIPYKFKHLLEIIYKYQTIHCPDSYIPKVDKVLIYDIYDLCSNANEFNVIFEMFDFDHIEIETIKQGKILKNSFKELEVKENEK